MPPLSVFGHFAERFMTPLVETVIGDAEDAAGDGGINYFILDLCTTLLRWTPLFPRLRSDTPDKRLPAEWSSAAQCLVNHIVSLPLKKQPVLKAHMCHQCVWLRLHTGMKAALYATSPRCTGGNHSSDGLPRSIRLRG